MDKDQSIDMEGLSEEVDTFMFGGKNEHLELIIFELKYLGHDTVSAALTWTIQEIGNNQEVLKKCLAEIDEVFGDSDRPASIDDLNRLEVIIFFPKYLMLKTVDSPKGPILRKRRFSKKDGSPKIHYFSSISMHVSKNLSENFHRFRFLPVSSLTMKMFKLKTESISFQKDLYMCFPCIIFIVIRNTGTIPTNSDQSDFSMAMLINDMHILTHHFLLVREIVSVKRYFNGS